MELVFELGSEVVIARIKGNSILFANLQTNFQQFVPIDSLMLSKTGILKEHPDLAGLPDGEMRSEAIRRLKEHIKTFSSENETKDYVVSELEKFGWKLKRISREGFRSVSAK